MDELAAARRHLAGRVKDPKVVMLGLSDDIRALLSAHDELQRRTALLAEFAIQKHYWPASGVRKELLNELIEMGDNAAQAARHGAHGAGCVCNECLPIG